MSRVNTVYLNLKEITEVRKKDVFLKDVATVYCSDTVIQNKCLAAKIKTIRDDRCCRYVEDSFDVIRILEAIDPSIQVNNVGQTAFIISYHSPERPHLIWQWIKTIFVCLISFSGAAFAIMTFNNDVSAPQIFQETYKMVMGQESDGFTIIELSYSVGLAFGILVFFNHFAKWKVTTDPTPLEVEMRLYEDNVSKTIIQNDGRREQGIDVR